MVGVVYGDLNGDGVIDGADVILMLRYFTRPDVAINLAAADVNGDGTVDIADLILLLRYFSQPGIVLGPQ
jgi:endoglucanase